MNPNLEVISWADRWKNPDLSSEERHDMNYWLLKRQLKALERFRFTYAQPDRPGFDSRQVQRLAKLQDRVLKIADKICRPDMFPFYPVLPRDIVQTFDIITKLPDNGSRWESALSLNKVINLKRKPLRPCFFPYFVFNIHNGSSFTGSSPETAGDYVKSMGFLEMNLAEAVQYLWHSDSLDQPFSIHASGSRYRDENFVPGLYKDQDGPKLISNPANLPKIGWNCPSYQTFKRASSLQGFISPKAWIRMGTWARIRRGFFSYRAPRRCDDADSV